MKNIILIAAIIFFTQGTLALFDTYEYSKFSYVSNTFLAGLWALNVYFLHKERESEQ